MRSRKVRYINQKKYEKKVTPISYRPVGMLVATLGLFLLVQLLTLSIVGTKGAELSEVREEQRVVEENIRQLKAEISNATSLDRIEKIATKKMGMKKVEDVKYFEEGGYVSSASWEGNE